jgi:hypothetical protein
VPEEEKEKVKRPVIEFKAAPPDEPAPLTDVKKWKSPPPAEPSEKVEPAEKTGEDD